MKSFAALAAIVPLVAAHGFIKSPAPRQPGDAYKAACGDQPYYQQTSDINGNVQGIMQVVGSDFDASTCNLWLCKGFLLADNTDLVQSYTAGETVDFEITIAAPHTGYANVSVVKTSSNSIIGTPLIEFTNYASNSGMPANNTAFSVTIPDDLGSECTTAGDCVLQWFWDAPDIDQTYESCVDFTVGGSSSGGSGSGSASSAVASSAAPAVTSAAATTAVAAVTEPAVTSAITPVASSAAAVTSAITPVASSAAAVVTSEAAATTSAAADEEECPADEDEGDDEDTGADDDEECPADEDEGDDEGDDEDDCDDEADETTIETTVAVAPTVAAVSVASSAAAQVTSAAASYAVPSAAQSGSSGSGNGSGNGNGSGAAVTSYVTVTGKPHTKTQMHTKYVTVTADAPACT